MSNSINRVSLLGHLGGDPERLKGGALAFSLATSDQWTDDDSGERRERTDWHRVVCFGKRADGLAKVLRKGSRIHVDGALRVETYEDRDGVKRRGVDIIVRDVVLCDPPPDGAKVARRAGRDDAADHPAQGGDGR